MEALSIYPMMVEDFSFLEKLKKGFEILYMVDAINEYVGQLKEFEENKLVSIIKERLKHNYTLWTRYFEGGRFVRVQYIDNSRPKSLWALVG